MTELSGSEREKIAIGCGGWISDSGIVTKSWSFSDTKHVLYGAWKPDSPDSPYWQIQLVMDAIREKCSITVKSYRDDWGVTLGNIKPLSDKWTKVHEAEFYAINNYAPTFGLAICRAYLEALEHQSNEQGQ